MRGLQSLLVGLPGGKLHHDGARGCGRCSTKLGATNRSLQMLKRNNRILNGYLILVIVGFCSPSAIFAQTQEKVSPKSQAGSVPKSRGSAPAQSKFSAAEIAAAKTL